MMKSEEMQLTKTFKLRLATWRMLQSIKTSYFIIAVSIFCFSFKPCAQAQQNTQPLTGKNQFRVGIGVSYLQTVDFQFSPIVYQGVRENLELGYSSKWEKGIFSTNLNLFIGALSPNSGPTRTIYIKETDIYGTETDESKKLELSQMGFNLEIGYLHELPPFATTRTAFYLGGSLEENLTFAPGFLSIGTINYASVNAKTRFDYGLKNGKPVIFQLSIPIVSLVTRMPYHNAPNLPGKSGLAGFFTGNNEIKTINKFQNARVSVKYNWLVRKRTAFDVTYEASWLHYYQPEHLTQADSQLSLGLTF